MKDLEWIHRVLRSIEPEFRLPLRGNYLPNDLAI